MTPFYIYVFGFWSYFVAFTVGLLIRHLNKQYESSNVGFAHSIATPISVVILIIYLSIGDISNISTLKDFGEPALYVLTGVIWGVGSVSSVVILMFGFGIIIADEA